jgi:hypothetical protein
MLQNQRSRLQEEREHVRPRPQPSLRNEGLRLFDPNRRDADINSSVTPLVPQRVICRQNPAGREICLQVGDVQPQNTLDPAGGIIRFLLSLMAE